MPRVTQIAAIEGRKQGVETALQTYSNGGAKGFLSSSDPRGFLQQKTKEAYQAIKDERNKNDGKLLDKEKIIADLHLICDYKLGVYSQNVTFDNGGKSQRERLIIRDARMQDKCIEQGLVPYKNFDSSYLGMIVNQFRAAEELIDIATTKTPPEKYALKEHLDTQLRHLLDNAITLIESKDDPAKTEAKLHTLNRATTGFLQTFLYDRLPLEEENQTRVTATQWGLRLNKAKDYANFRDNHGSVVTYTKVEYQDRGRTIEATPIQISLKLSELTEEQEKQLNELQNEEWFKNLPSYEQQLINKHLPSILTGDKTIPTQIRTIPALRNAWLSILQCSEGNNPPEILFEKARSGAPVLVVQPTGPDEKLKAEAAKKSAELTSLILKQIKGFFDTNRTLHLTSLNRESEGGIIQALRGAKEINEQTENNILLSLVPINWAAAFSRSKGESEVTTRDRVRSTLKIDRRKTNIQQAVLRANAGAHQGEIDETFCKSGKDRTGSMMYWKEVYAIRDFFERKLDQEISKKLQEKIELTLARGGQAQIFCGLWSGTNFCSALKPLPVGGRIGDPVVPKHVYNLMFNDIARENNLKVQRKVYKPGNILKGKFKQLKVKVDKRPKDFANEIFFFQNFVSGLPITESQQQEIIESTEGAVTLNAESDPKRSFAAMVRSKENVPAKQTAETFIKSEVKKIYQDFQKKYGLTSEQFKLFLHLADLSADHEEEGRTGFKFFLAHKIKSSRKQGNGEFLSALLGDYKGADKENLIKSCESNLAGDKNDNEGKKADKYFCHIDNKGRKQSEEVDNNARLFTERMLNNNLTPEQKKFCHVMMVLSAKLQNLSKDAQDVFVHEQSAGNLARSKRIASYLLRDANFVNNPESYIPKTSTSTMTR